MGWLRIDDGFASHPKIGQLTDRELRAWVRLLCYASRYRTDGYLSEAILNENRVKNRLKTKLISLRLLDELDDENGKKTVRIHDWSVYNGSTDDAVGDYLDQNPDASANEVFRAIGGNRNRVLSAVAEHRSGGIKPVPNGTKSGISDTAKSGIRSGIESGIRARGPSPKDLPAAAESLESAAAAATNLEPDLAAAFAAVGWNQTQIAAATTEPERARAWLTRAAADDVRAPGAFAWSGYQQGGWPAGHENDRPKAPIIDVATNAVRMVLWQYDDDAIRDELRIMQTRLGQTLDDGQIDALLELAAESRTTNRADEPAPA